MLIDYVEEFFKWEFYYKIAGIGLLGIIFLAALVYLIIIHFINRRKK